jgi:hypothetical protein
VYTIDVLFLFFQQGSAIKKQPMLVLIATLKLFLDPEFLLNMRAAQGGQI